MKAKKIILFVFWLLVFVGVVYMVVRADAARDNMACEKYAVQVRVEHTADTLLYPVDIENIMLKHDTIIGKPYHAIDLYALEGVLKQQPAVSEVHIYGDMLGTLRITATQRVPIVRIIDALNQSFYLDETAQVMPARPGTSAHVITVSGNIGITRDQALADTLKQRWDALIACVKFINNDAFLRCQIGQIYIENENLALMIPVIGKHKIIFGSLEHPEKRLTRLKIFYQRGMDAEKWANYRSIDLRYKSQIVCKR